MDINELLMALETAKLDAESNVSESRRVQDGEGAIYNQGVAAGLDIAIKKVVQIQNK